MLQQTQVTRVISAWETFLAMYPEPDSFAAASSAEVITAWGGLGYLRRARNLHAAAQRIAEHGWPADLTDLPGVGPYTAAAVGAFAFGRVEAAVDINLRRVLSRWEGDLLTEQRARQLAHVDPARPADWNQAMMDLGATVCRPNPRCDRCPVDEWCADPSIEVRSAAQSPFEGSRRQARAAILRRLALGPLEDLAELRLDPAVATSAVESLVEEGSVVHHGGRLVLR